MDDEGRQPSRREAGTMFGPDVTKRFLEENHLELLVRSHEVKMEGYDVQHDISFCMFSGLVILYLARKMYYDFLSTELL